MNGEKPKFRLWKDVVTEQKEIVKLCEQSLAINEAILKEAEAQVAKERPTDPKLLHCNKLKGEYLSKKK